MNNDKYIKYLESLENAVWTTRKNRINAEGRLLGVNRFVQHINIYYACLSAAIAIIGLWYTDKALTMLGAILAPIVTICIAFLNSQRYEQRAADIKRNYVELQKILYEVRRLKSGGGDATPDWSKVKELDNKYCELMDKVENHRQSDYWKTCFESGTWDKKDSEHPFLQKIHKAYYRGYIGLRWSMHGLAYVAPIIGCVLLRFLFAY